MTDGPSRAEIATALADARARSLGMLDPIPARDQARQVSDLMSPLCWDLAHIGHYEELWLVRRLSGAAPTDPTYRMNDDKDFAPERERLVALVKRFAESGRASADGRVHPFFGRLTGDQWGRLSYKHLDHHLRQFGV